MDIIGSFSLGMLGVVLWNIVGLRLEMTAMNQKIDLLIAKANP